MKRFERRQRALIGWLSLSISASTRLKPVVVVSFGSCIFAYLLALLSTQMTLNTSGV